MKGGRQSVARATAEMCSATTLAQAGLILCLVVGSRQLSITELVVPASARVNESVELECRFDRGGSSEDMIMVKWWWTPYNSTTERKQLYQRLGNNPVTVFHELQSKGNDTLILSELSPEDSGTYECEVSSMGGDNEEIRKHQDLTVFSPGPGLQLNITEVEDGPDEDTEEDVQIVCRADDVAPAPDILLTIDGEQVNMTEDIIGPDALGFYDAVGTATVSKSAVETATVVCELFYTDPNITHEQFVASQVYQSELTTTEAAEESTEPGVTPDSLQNQSGDSIATRASWGLMLAQTAFTLLLILL